MAHLLSLGNRQLELRLAMMLEQLFDTALGEPLPGLYAFPLMSGPHRSGCESCGSLARTKDGVCRTCQRARRMALDIWLQRSECDVRMVA
jgi:hypothetical protein